MKKISMMRKFLAGLFSLWLAAAPVAAMLTVNQLDGFNVGITSASGEITLVGIATATATDSNNVTVTLPVGTTTNDVVYAILSFGSSTDEVLSTVTSGYTTLVDIFADDNRNVNFGVFRKVMGGSPDTTVEFNVGGTLSETGSAGAVIVLRGVNTSTPEDATTTTATGIDGSQIDPASITTVTNGAWVIPAAGWSNPAVPTVPTNYSDFTTALADDAQDSRVMLATRLIVSAGAENPGVFGNTIGAGTDAWAAATIAVRPGS